MKKTLKIISIIIACVILTFIVPIVINELYKTNSGYTTLWEAKDVLSFYGVILASVIAGFGVFVTIRASQKSNIQSERNGVLPFFQIEPMDTNVTNSFNLKDKIASGAKDETTSEAKEIKQEGFTSSLNKAFAIILEKGNISYQKELTVSQKRNRDNVLSCMFGGVECLPIEITNVGNGPAINAKCAFYTGNAKEEEIFERNIHSYKIDESTIITLFTENINDCLGKYVFELTYFDIYGNKYSQKLFFNLTDSDTPIEISVYNSQELLLTYEQHLKNQKKAEKRKKYADA